MSEEYGLGKFGIITLVHKGNGASIYDLETELIAALEGGAITKNWKVEKVTVLDGDTTPISI